MDTATVIETHRAALLRILAMLFAASGLVPGKPGILSRIIRNSVLEQLRTAESAGRRLIETLAAEMAARGLVLKPRAQRTMPPQKIPRGDGTRVPPFALFDPRKRPGANNGRRYAKGVGPRIFFFDGTDPVVEQVVEEAAVPRDGPVDASALCRRMQALKAALEDPEKQALRLLRIRARRAQAGGAPKRTMRPGRPPGHRARVRYEVDEILRECHQLALKAQIAPDTS